jgi:HK97 family phage prohead protease
MSIIETDEVVETIVDEPVEETVDDSRGDGLEREVRTAHSAIEVREESDGMVFEGYAAVFDSPSQPLPFIEKIDRGAFTRSLKSRNDVKLLWNHDTSQVLGSTRAKTLTLVEDERGLKVQGVLPNTSAGRDAAELLKRGDVDSMSFGFTVIRDAWSADGNERTLKAVRLHEVSIVAFPAYAGTAGTTSVRNLDVVAERAQVDADQLTAALTKVEAGEDITPADRDLLSAVINTLAPADEPEEVSAEMLALKKKKLQLLKGL